MSTLTARLLITLLFPAVVLVPSVSRTYLEASPLPTSMEVQSQPVDMARFEQGDSWTVAGPVTLTVRFNGNVLLASWQWLGNNGQPVSWQGSQLPPSELRPVGSDWSGRMAAPPLPGTYSVRVVARVSTGGGNSTEVTTSLNLRGTALPDEKPFTRGLAYALDGNVWLRSVDMQRERAVTFYGHPRLAYAPTWSPTGNELAFILDPGEVDGTTELWVVRPNGTGPRKIASASEGRTLAFPVYAPDGTLYVGESRLLRVGGNVLGETYDLQRVDRTTGDRAPVLAGMSMPAFTASGSRLVYIRQEINEDLGLDASLVASDLDGRNEQTLVPTGVLGGIYAPDWSPDGSRVVFAGLPGLDATGRKSPGLAAPLSHGGTWDLYTIPASGGTPHLVSPVQEDLPYPRWSPDGSRIYFISPTGLWTVPASGGMPQLEADSRTHSALSIFAPVPKEAPPLTGPTRCFQETGRCLRGLFMQYWERNGGLSQLGFPISPELTEEGRIVQYTERARLEWHPEYKGTASEVLAGRLGADFADTRRDIGEAPFQRQPQSTDRGARYFPETGHTLRPPLRAYWEAKGGLPVFGYPLSEAFQERSPTDGKTYLVQYFERNRLEYHPENRGTTNEVLLGLLGVQEYERRYR